MTLLIEAVFKQQKYIYTICTSIYVHTYVCSWKQRQAANGVKVGECEHKNKRQ